MSQSVPMKRQRKSHINESNQQPTRKRVTTSDSTAQAKKRRMKKAESLTSNSLISTQTCNDLSTGNTNTMITSISSSIDQTNHCILQLPNNIDYGQSVPYPVVSLANQSISSQSLDSIPPPPLFNPLDNARDIFDNTIAPFI